METDYILPFEPQNGRTYHLDGEKKQVARSLAAKMGISFNSALASSWGGGDEASLPQERIAELTATARNTIIQAGGQDKITMNHICYQKMAVTGPTSSERNIYLNILAHQAGYFMYDLPDGKGGFVIMDPRTERTTSWHPDKATREAACVVGSLVLREAGAKGLSDLDDLTAAMNTLALDPETGLMKDLEQSFGGLGIDGKPKPKEQEVEQITLTSFELPNVEQPEWMDLGHTANAAETQMSS